MGGKSARHSHRNDSRASGVFPSPLESMENKVLALCSFQEWTAGSLQTRPLEQPGNRGWLSTISVLRASACWLTLHRLEVIICTTSGHLPRCCWRKLHEIVQQNFRKLPNCFYFSLCITCCSKIPQAHGGQRNIGHRLPGKRQTTGTQSAPDHFTTELYNVGLTI